MPKTTQYRTPRPCPGCEKDMYYSGLCLDCRDELDWARRERARRAAIPGLRRVLVGVPALWSAIKTRDDNRHGALYDWSDAVVDLIGSLTEEGRAVSAHRAYGTQEAEIGVTPGRMHAATLREDQAEKLDRVLRLTQEAVVKAYLDGKAEGSDALTRLARGELSFDQMAEWVVRA